MNKDHDQRLRHSSLERMHRKRSDPSSQSIVPSPNKACSAGNDQRWEQNETPPFPLPIRDKSDAPRPPSRKITRHREPHESDTMIMPPQRRASTWASATDSTPPGNSDASLSTKSSFNEASASSDPWGNSCSRTCSSHGSSQQQETTQKSPKDSAPKHPLKRDSCGKTCCDSTVSPKMPSRRESAEKCETRFPSTA